MEVKLVKETDNEAQGVVKFKLPGGVLCELSSFDLIIMYLNEHEKCPFGKDRFC